jgi:predicted adenine nucleotide alpha hydrolase (AANH) superfamily ATPase
MDTNTPASEQFLVAANAWVDAEAAADLLETTKSAVLAQMMQKLGDKLAINKAERNVKAGTEWYQHVTKIAKAREQANRCKVAMEYKRMKFAEWQSHEANERTIARL